MISSMKNDQVKHLIQLQKSGKERRKSDVFVVEGIRMVSEISAENMIKLYYSESYFEKRKDSLPHLAYEILADHIFEQVSDTETPQGILAVVKQTHYELTDLIKGDRTLIVILENLQNPGNLGTILRSGEGAGITGVILNEGCADIYNPKTIRGSMGSVLRVPYYKTSDLEDTIRKIGNEFGVKTYATALDGSVEYDQKDYSEPSAIIIGNEGNGLSQKTLDISDYRIRIPMEGKVESLNAGIAASILLYEVYRQRRS